MKIAAIVSGIIVSLALSPAAFAKTLSMYERFDGKTVKVFVAPITDSTSEKAVGADVLQAKLSEALMARKSTRFIVVPTEGESEITIHTDIAEFLWTDKDPIDMLMGVGGAAMDAAITEDYARLMADMSVTDTKKQKELWKGRVMATVTQKPMSQTDSVPLVSENFAKTFIKTTFGKTKK